MKRFFTLALLLQMSISAIYAQPTKIIYAEPDQNWTNLSCMPIVKGNVDMVTVAEYELKEVYGKLTKGKQLSLNNTYTFKFNEQGIIYESVLLVSNELYHKTLYTYDTEKRLVEEIYQKGAKEEKTMYKYDANGRRVSYSIYDKDGSLIGRGIYRYNEMGKLIEEIGKKYNSYNNSGWDDYQKLYKYDTKGNMTEYNPCKADRKTTYDYDSNGKLVREIQYNGFSRSQGYIEYYYVYKYDANGRFHQRICCKFDGTIDYVYTYQYDSIGNIVAILRFDGEVMIPRSFVEYNITYRK
ncbi:MAG: hypothetical protein IKL60_01505 [Alistipes sp.]|nr:hypothetical protein [Alistipes sp.]